MKTYKVVETHIGDRPHAPYQPGETREMTAADAKALLDQNMIEEVTDAPAADAEKPKAPAKKAAN